MGKCQRVSRKPRVVSRWLIKSSRIETEESPRGKIMAELTFLRKKKMENRKTRAIRRQTRNQAARLRPAVEKRQTNTARGKVTHR